MTADRADFFVGNMTRPVTRQPWMSAANCIGEDPELFFPGDHVTREQMLTVKAICGGCSVTVDCATFGLSESHGVWGGMTPDELTRLRGHGPRMSRPLTEYIGRVS